MSLRYKVLWFFLLLLLLIFGGYWAAYGLDYPVLPPTPKPKAKPAGVSQGDGAKLLTIKAIVPPAMKLNLVWNYWTNDPAIQFNVRSVKTNRVVAPSFKWPILATVKTNGYPLTVDKKALLVFFAVTATNLTTHLESTNFASPPKR